MAVDFVRLTELGESREVQSLMEAGQPGGLLAPIKEANRNLEEMRLLAERLAFMVTRMQLMIEPPGRDGVGQAGDPARSPSAARGLEDLHRGVGPRDRGLRRRWWQISPRNDGPPSTRSWRV